MTTNQFYTLLKSRVTGQVINGVLTGVLLESDLKEIYEQCKQSNIDKSEENEADV